MKCEIRFAALTLSLLLLAGQTAYAQETMTGRAVIEANIEATGGIQSWRDATDLVTEADIEFEIPQMGTLIIKLESWSMFPGYGFTNIELIDGPAAVPAEQVNQRAYYTPLEGWVEGGQGRTELKDMPPAQRSQLQRSSAKSELEFLNLPDSALVILEDVMLNEKAVYAVSVTTNGVASTYLYDKETMYNLGQEMTTPMGKVMSLMSDFRDVGGFIFPFLQTADLGGQGMQTITFSNIEINSGLTPNAIAKKAGMDKKTVAPE